MVSAEARRELARMFGQRKPDNRPLAQARREWEEEAATRPVLEGARFTPAYAGGIPAEWIDVPRAAPEKVFLWLHGGGYNSGSPRTHRQLGAQLAAATGMRVLMPDYRLAPEHKFPAAVEDAFTVYQWLRKEGIVTSRLVVGGDSAGGGLALALLLKLRDEREIMPRCAVLLSPWTDLSVSSPSYDAMRYNDPIIRQASLREAGVWYAGEHLSDPLASPVNADLAGLPPTLVHVGGDEVMLDDSKKLAEKGRAARIDITLKVWPGLWHVFHHDAPRVPEAAQAIKEIGNYIKGRVS